MYTILAKNWWFLIVRGLAALSLAFAVLMWHDISLEGLVLLFGGYAILDGLAGLAGAVCAAASHERWTPLLVEGLAGIAAALVAFLWPGMMLLDLAYVIAAWALLTGGLEIAAAVCLRRQISGEMLLLLGGAASLIPGIFMIVLPLNDPCRPERVSPPTPWSSGHC
jgi:uncharacterized membrane protein HdeD (DUF308 family)